MDHAGAVWHVTSRGNERREVFRDDSDRVAFLNALGDSVRLHRWQVYAYVLMTNHYHLLIETPEATLSKGMHWLNGSYTQKYNKRHERVGHLFQGRYTSILVERESHLLTLIRYVVLNPVRAGMTRRAADWRWSSYRATVGSVVCPEWLNRSWILSQFGNPPGSLRRYRKFIDASDGLDDRPWEALEGRMFLGGPGFRTRAETLLKKKPEVVDVPRACRKPVRPQLELIAKTACIEFRCAARQLRSREESGVRLAFAVLCRRDALEPARRYASVLGVGPSGASRLAKRAEALLAANERFRHHVDRIRATMRAEFENGGLTPVSKMET